MLETLSRWSFDEKYFATLKAPEKDKLEKEKKVGAKTTLQNPPTFQLIYFTSGQRHLGLRHGKVRSS